MLDLALLTAHIEHLFKQQKGHFFSIVSYQT